MSEHFQPSTERTKEKRKREGLHSKDGRYETVRKLGEGGMGAVYLARIPEQSFEYAGKQRDTLVVIKVLLNDEFSEEIHDNARFRQEQLALDRLSSNPWVITPYEYIEMEDGRMGIVMEYGAERGPRMKVWRSF